MSINKNIIDIEIDDDLEDEELDITSQSKEEDEVIDIQNLASQILSSEIDDDEYDDEDDDEEDDSDELITVGSLESNIDFENDEDNELLKQANKIINSSSENITNDSNIVENEIEKEEKLFGKYKIIKIGKIKILKNIQN